MPPVIYLHPYTKRDISPKVGLCSLIGIPYRMPVRRFIPSRTHFHICLFKETSQGVHAPFLTYM
ncbi:hypothetical protein HMPREF1988_01591 [Porphyromonas gingivalis F0185]|nr:hypothetical protein HMPREF1988_01591 [Porphyromonas gingivalis F0185]